jgi:hypothetical protein
MIIHHHLGLGDHFVCNGLVNCLSDINNNNITYLVCKKHNYETVEYLYSENPKIIVIPIEGDEFLETHKLSESLNVNILRIGFEHCDLNNWDRSFYSQLNIDFIERYNNFRLPKEKPKNILPIPNKPYILIHNKSSETKYDLDINTDLYKVYIIKQEGYHLLSYLDIINNAEEIHCIDSAVFHLIDSLSNITNKLYYHDVRKNLINFNKSSKWKEF